MRESTLGHNKSIPTMQFRAIIPGVIQSKSYNMLALTGWFNTSIIADQENVEQILKYV